MQTKIDPYTQYATDKTKDNLNLVVTSLQPTITYALKSIGADTDPVMKARANIEAAYAIDSYSPTSGASLKTHVTNQLQRLYRENRKRKSAIAVPDRLHLDRRLIDKHTAELQDRLNREPTIAEIADSSGLPPRRVKKVNESSMGVTTEGTFEGNIGGEMTDWAREAVEYAYFEADPTDKKILELKTGLWGHKPLSPKDIAIKLNIEPYVLTRRSIKLTGLINSIVEDLKTTNNV